MTEATIHQMLAPAKGYAHVDFDDDDDLIKLMIEAAAESMQDVIPRFDPEKLTGRQKILIFSMVKNLYDHRDMYVTQTGKVGPVIQDMKIDCQSMLNSEIYEGRAKQWQTADA